MTDSARLQEAMDRLNPEQLQAVEHLDGPLLVIAGPGTGKTQLLSLRAANILAKRDVSPSNILCLTYTEAGAEAMRKRLVELVGRDAYGIQVCTFHGFANAARTLYPDAFSRAASDKLVTGLHQIEIMDGLLQRRSFRQPLSGVYQGVARYTREMLAFVSKVKRSGVSYEQLAAIAQQNLQAADWLEQNSPLCDLAAQRAGVAVAERFEEEVSRAYFEAPLEVKRVIVTTPGMYVPFVEQLYETVMRTELVNEEGKTSGFRKVRDEFFGGTNKDGRFFKVRKQSEKLAAACEVARQYQAVLDEQGLYDYDDMISDFVHAVEENPSLRQTLQDRYAYIQVDEFQDTNGAQMRIVELLCEGLEQPNVMAVGDDDQAIMRFQGATIECINQFTERYKPCNVVLRTNYRSTPAIVDLGQKVACQVERRLGASEGKQIVAHRAQGDQLTFSETVYETQAEEYRAIARSIRERMDSGYAESCGDADQAIAVIAPKHATLRALIPYLVAEDVPFSYKQTQDVLTAECTQAVLAGIRCVAALSQGREQLCDGYLPQVVAAPEFGGCHESSVAFALWARREHHGRWLRAMGESSNARIKGLHDDLMRWAAKAPCASVRELLFEIAAKPLSYYRRLNKVDPLASAEFNAGMRALLRFAEGELDVAGRCGTALRLADVVDRLDAAERYKVAIDASLSLGKPGAVRLTSAHSSKGLEFECVYLADADDGTWHKGAASGGLYPDNLLIGDAKDEDDARRLLFVALTRARRHLLLFRAGGQTLQELVGEVSTDNVSPEPECLDAAIECDWRASYKLDTPQLAALLSAEEDVCWLTASKLNAFVTYEAGCVNSATFPEREVVRLPSKPNITTEFGTEVHAMLEDVSNMALGAARRSLDKVVAAHRANIAHLDFPAGEVSQYLERFDAICKTFVPWLMEHVAGCRCVAEARLHAATAAGSPIYGIQDLLLVDDEAKTVRIIDYKTGLKHEVPTKYERQLKFYKLLVESSAEFEGYTVEAMGDYYVEPDKKTGELSKPFMATATAEEVRELERLTDAVWARVCEGAWDTSAFEQSQLFEQAREQQEGCRNKKEKAAVMQQAYEQWLVETAPGC